MTVMRKRLGLIILLGVALPAFASDEEQILQILEDTRSGWENADGAPFKKHFLDYDGARYFESGGQNIGLTDLIEHHVEPEGDALSLDLQFNNPQVEIFGDIAWVLVDTVVEATIKRDGRKIHNTGHQTTLLKKIDGHWRVLHTHSSSRPVKGPQAEEME